MYRKNIFISIAIILLCFALTSCDSELQYVDPVVSDNQSTTADVMPWSTPLAFDYEASSDNVINVVNCCATSISTQIEIDDNRLYVFSNNAVVRYNPENNNVTSLCPDPLCMHNTPDCPFYRIDHPYGFHIYQNNVLYRQTYEYRKKGVIVDTANRISSYNIENHKLSKLQDITSSLLSPNKLFIDDYYLYTDVTYDEESSAYLYSLCSQNIYTGKTDVLITEDCFSTHPFIVIGNNVYFARNNETYVASKDSITDMRKIYGYIERIAYCKSGYFIFTDSEGNLYRMNTNGEDVRSLNISNVEYFYLTDNYIYYMVHEGSISGNTSYNNDPITLDYQAVYRTDHNNNNNQQTLVWKNTGENKFIYLEDFIVYGNYIYSVFAYFSIEGNNVSGYSSCRSKTYTYARINCNNAQTYYINIET